MYMNHCNPYAYNNICRELDINQAISKVMHIIINHFQWNIKAIILFGSYATGENTEETKDIDLCVIERFYNPFIDVFLNNVINDSFFKISICHYPINNFNKLDTLLAYDVSNTGRIIYGHKEVLRKHNKIHKYEAIKVLFNYGVVKLNSCVSENILSNNVINKNQDKKIVYGCMKAFEGICIALLILRNNYTHGYKARAELLSETYQNYGDLYRQIADLPEKISFFAKVRLGGNVYIGNPINLWFQTKKYIESIMPFIIHNYFKDNETDVINNVLKLNRLQRNFIPSLMYMYRLFIKNRNIAPLTSILVQPIAKIHIANACILFSINESLNIDKHLLCIAEDHIKTIYPISTRKNTSLFHKWEIIRNICVNLNEESIASQIDINDL